MKILCVKCKSIWDTLTDWEANCGDTHDWEDWEGDRYILVDDERTEAVTELLSKIRKGYSTCEWNNAFKQIKYYQEYPYNPYYYSPRKNTFLCTEHSFKTQNIKEFLTHLFDYHKSDVEPFLKFHLRQIIEKRIREQKGSSEHLSEETLDSLVESEWKELCYNAQLTEGNNRERLQGWLSQRDDLIREWLVAKSDVCPLCHIGKEGLILEDKDMFTVNQIMSKLKNGIKNLSGKETFVELTQNTYASTWNGECISVSLGRALHMHLKHNASLKALCNAGILAKDKDCTNDLLKFLAYKCYEGSKKEKLSLSALLEEYSQPPMDKSGVSQNPLRKWLKDH